MNSKQGKAKMNRWMIAGMLVFALAAPGALAAGSEEGAEAQRAQEEQWRRHQEELLAAIEQSRREAERAAEEARLRAEQLHVETGRLRAERERMRREAGVERVEEMREIARAREELSRTHRELHKASQEIARAHRDLAMAEDRRIRSRVINLGDRAMIGVVLGEETESGIEILGVSPDGPAERAGIQTGDVLLTLRGQSLTEAEGRSAREAIFDVMSGIEKGEELSVGVLRGGERRDFMVTPELREPRIWQSRIRLPEPPVPPESGYVLPAPDAPRVIVERIAVPRIDHEALAAKLEAIGEEFENFDVTVIGEDGEPLGYGYDFGFDDYAFSDLGGYALGEAQVWFGTPAMRGIRFAELNEKLGAYFKAERGALVLEAPEDNALRLEPGDVVLRVGDSDVNSTADIVRALRDFEPGDTVEIAIKRDKRDRSLDVVMPENRLGALFFKQP